MKKYIYPLAITATALFATACSDNEVDDIQNIPDSQKETISFSLSDGTTNTRAGFTGSETSLAMRIQSDEKGGSGVKYTRTVATASKDATNNTSSYSNVTFQDSYKRYWDDAFGRKGQLSVYAVAVPNAGASLKNNNLTLEELLEKGDASEVWGSTATNTIAWQVTQDAQEKDASTVTSPVKNIDIEDLVYSNNIQADGTLGKDGCYKWNYATNSYPTPTGAEGQHGDGPMVFTQAAGAADSDPGHFDKGHLKFKHALSRITITLVAGEGFADKPFEFASGTNIKLLGMNVKGSLNIKTGEWTVATSGGTGAINKMAKTTTETNAAGKYMAQMLPGYSFEKTSSTNVAEFTIDDNVYYVTQKMLFDALTSDDGDLASKKDDSEIKMEQGKNYQFKITVNKKQIESITATLAPWVDVTAADQSMDNSHVQFTFTAPTGTNCTDFQFYRLKEALSGGITTGSDYTAVAFSGDYKTEGAATIEEMTSVSGKYQATGWYYDDNKTAYHFRTLNALAADENGSDSDDKSENITNTADPAKSYFTMTADATLKDYHWGAPMTKDPTAATDPAEAYSPTEGFKGCLYKGVTSTTSDLKITEIHMMSNIKVVLKTSTGSDNVNLTGATVNLTQLSTKATVDMGIGLITPLSPESPTTWATATQSTTASTNTYTCAVIPQELIRGTSTTHADTDYVGITITTADGNEYYVVKTLSDITATAVSGHLIEENQAIKRWYPGHTYTYTFTITKKGIENITCVLANWIDVTAGNTNLDLES